MMLCMSVPERNLGRMKAPTVSESESGFDTLL